MLVLEGNLFIFSLDKMKTNRIEIELSQSCTILVSFVHICSYGY